MSSDNNNLDDLEITDELIAESLRAAKNRGVDPKKFDEIETETREDPS